MERRKFIQLIGRSFLMSALVGGSAYILLKKKEEGNCDFEFICKECKQLNSCKLEEANHYKKTLTEQNKK